MSIKNRAELNSKRFGGKKVLLAEVSLINAVHTESILKDWNLDIEVVRNGIEAVQKIKDNQYDILLIGVHMPATDGLEAAKQIRLLGVSMDVLPILALTADTIPMELLTENGINDIILKPSSAEDLEGKLTHYLKHNF
jgi:CheY-like chemotaxis protein